MQQSDATCEATRTSLQNLCMGYVLQIQRHQDCFMHNCQCADNSNPFVLVLVWLVAFLVMSWYVFYHVLVFIALLPVLTDFYLLCLPAIHVLSMKPGSRHALSRRLLITIV